jgi:hypothetical protein
MNHLLGAAALLALFLLCFAGVAQCKAGDNPTIYRLQNRWLNEYLYASNGWPVVSSRYNGIADMYVDYVRVYQQ